MLVVVLPKLLERTKSPFTEMGAIGLGKTKMNHSVSVLGYHKIFLYLVCQLSKPIMIFEIFQPF